MKKWSITRPDEAAAGALTKGSDLEPLCAAVLAARGIRTVQAAADFLGSDELSDPFLIRDMQEAAEVINEAVESGKPICVYGDYDCDGVTATVMLYSYLECLGADVRFYIPERSEGYGMNEASIRQLAQEGVSLIITVDNGIAAIEEAEFAASLGVDLIVTDHHLPHESLPQAVAIVDPRRADDHSPFKGLCGAGVAFKLCAALDGCPPEEMLEYCGDLAAVGTVADVMPLTGENRTIVKAGLRQLQNTDRPGFCALLEEVGLAGRPVTAENVSYAIAPRINAAGRMDSAVTALQLVLCEDEDRAVELAHKLSDINIQRQETEMEIVKAAQELLDAEPERLEDRVILLWGRDWHPGVIGIAASRLVDKFYKPTIVLSVQEDGICRGSCRSIEGLNMYEALSACKEHLLQFGGHAMAAGLSLREEELPAFRAAFAAYAGAHLSEEDYEPKVSVEFEMMPEELTLDLVEELSLLEPYGMGNPKPYFGCRNVRGREAMAIGREQNHLRFKLGTEEAPVTSLMWNRADLAAAVNREALDVVYAPAINEWNGRRSLQCMVEDLSPAASERVFPEKELLRDIYRYFYAMQRGQGLIPFDTAVLTAGFCQSFHHISQYTMGAALRIFQELGILRENLNENRYYLPPVQGKQGKQGKMELDASPTYRRHKVI